MPPQADARIGAAELERVVKAVEPSAFLVPPRILRRVIRSDRRLAGIGIEVPHAKSYLIGRDALRPLVDREELGLKPDGNLPATALLLVRPPPELLAALSRGEVLVRYWRLLFHAHVHLALERSFREHRLSEAALRQRIHLIGQAEFNEIRAVLRQEHFLLPPRDDRTVYIEFAAVYLELRHFARSLLPRYFPALQSYDSIDAFLGLDLDVYRLLAGTRLPGAPDPAITAPDTSTPAEPPVLPPPAGPPSEAAYHLLVERAERAAALGNGVRATLLKTRAAGVAPPDRVAEAQAGAEAELDRLVDRLRAALELDGAAAEQWRQALTPLREPAARGTWPTEARLLYDLQKVCVDRERDVYAVDLIEWAHSLGKRPVQRLLPYQPDVLTLKHLRSAARRLPAARVAETDRVRLGALVQAAIHWGEDRVREKLRPPLEETLDEVGLCPRNFAEQIARHKLIEELLDQAGERGYLTMGDLRDAISRNNLKLPDLAGPGEFLLGDPLLRANGRLAVVLDGIYHRGEVYLRSLQRLSSLAFGTTAGRFLTRYFALPFGGAFIILKGVYHLIEEITHFLPGEDSQVRLTSLESPLAIGLLGVFLFLLLNVAGFRRGVFQGLTLAGRGLRALLVRLPARVLRLPLVRRLLRSRALRFCYHYGFKPLLPALLLGLTLYLLDAPPELAVLAGAAVFLAIELLMNSRLGRDLEEGLGDWLMFTWQRVRTDILPGLFRWVLEFFKGLVEAVDRGLYAVDEWLRFRAGEGRLTLVVKAVLGLFWSAVTYAVRFIINLLVEPQVNPIKHFPVVTVSHKLLLPFIPALTGVLSVTMEAGLALTAATVIIASIPGIFGFLVWELKENWRLYRANRPGTLQPTVIGHHGETMSRLLRPGFHSGTLPKLYGRLRRAERQALRSRAGGALFRQRAALHQVEEAIRRLLERKFLAILERSVGWAGLVVGVRELTLGSNRVRVELVCLELSEAGVWIDFEEQSGWLLAGVVTPGWLPRLSAEQRRVLRAALAGLYKFAGVDLVRNQIESLFAPASVSYDVADEGLVVWTGAGCEVETVYDLHAGPVIAPRLTAGRPPTPLPELPAVPLLFRDLPLSWDVWIDAWEQDQAGKGLPGSFLEGVVLLPHWARAGSR